MKKLQEENGSYLRKLQRNKELEEDENMKVKGEELVYSPFITQLLSRFSLHHNEGTRCDVRASIVSYSNIHSKTVMNSECAVTF